MNSSLVTVLTVYDGEYRKWPNKRRGAYFIFTEIGAALIRERRLFQHWEEDREN